MCNTQRFAPRNILRKFEERGGTLPAFRDVLNAQSLERDSNRRTCGNCCCQFQSGQRDGAGNQAGEPAHVAKYAFQLAQSFNNFYHEHSVIAEEDADRRALFLWLTGYVHDQLLSVLGVY